MSTPNPLVPDYSKNCISNLVPAILNNDFSRLPFAVDAQKPTILLVLDGLGWEQLNTRKMLTPNISLMSSSSLYSVAPTTTACALTSITTGLSPSEHGIVGYRFFVDGYVINSLRWSDKSAGDLRKVVPPQTLQPYEPFLGEKVNYISNSAFRRTGFTRAVWSNNRLFGYRTPSTMLHNINELIGKNQFIVAYYDGIDKVSHEFGLNSEYDYELKFVDDLVGQIMEFMPIGSNLIISSDHGQIDCEGKAIDLDESLVKNVNLMTGEGRFRWLHCDALDIDSVSAQASDLYSDIAWIISKNQILDEGWLGFRMNNEVIGRLGDIAMVPFVNTAFNDPSDTGECKLVGRHGSLTPEEVLVPYLVFEK